MDAYPPSMPTATQAGEQWRLRLTGFQILYVLFTQDLGSQKLALHIVATLQSHHVGLVVWSRCFYVVSGVVP